MFTELGPSSVARYRINHEPKCPKCQYDLSGVVSSWKTACPLEGVCSECGTKLHWNAVMTAPLHSPDPRMDAEERRSMVLWFVVECLLWFACGWWA